ncbi:MAG: hypothetical protein L0Y56_10955 [Nitrospira sp.]|nr:hypothetical protein [Nitrospira sp.]
MELEKLKKHLEELEARIEVQRIALEKMREQIKELRQKSVTTCDACSIEFDLLANHYSIGLFDNIVYVKCPRCNKSIPVDSKDGVKKA